MSVLVVGSLNVDLVCRTKRVPNEGETVEGLDFEMFPGGKGANQAAAIKRLGGEVTLAGALGNDSYSDFYHNVLKKEQIDGSFIKTLNTSTGLAFITLEDGGQNRIIIIHGANYLFSIDDLSMLKSKIQEAKVCLTQLEMPMNVVEAFANLAFQEGKIFILNPAPACRLSRTLLRKVTFLTPNEHELGLLTDLPVDNLKEIETAAKRLLDLGVKNVIVTLGARGCLWVDKDNQILIPSIKVKPIDTTGAGDSFNGALAFCLDQGADVVSACRFATKAGALATLKKGALVSLPTIEEIRKL